LSGLLNLAGRVLGAGAGIVNAVAWAFAIWIPAAGLQLSGVSAAIAFLMTLLSVLAAIAALRGHAVMLFAMFLASFMPIGALLLRVDHWLRWVGVLDLVLLLGSALIWWSGRAGRRGSAA
jgi:hypothetical protein